MGVEQTKSILGFDIGGITVEGRLAALAIKLSVDGGNDLLTIWDRSHLESLLAAMFEQASRCFGDSYQQDVDAIILSTERDVIASRPTLVAPDLTDPPESARVHMIEPEYGKDVLTVRLTFLDGGRCSLALDGSRCLLLFGYANNTVSQLQDGIPSFESRAH